MAIRRRGAKWVADFYDGFGRRRWVTCATKAEALEAEARGRVEAQRASCPAVDPDVTIAAYAERFVTSCKARGVRATTLTRYEGSLRHHLLPRLGAVKVRELTRPMVKALLAEKLQGPATSVQGQKGARKTGRRALARGSVRHLLTTLNAVMAEAVEDQLITASPLQRLGKALGLRIEDDGSETKAMDRDQLARFLEVARDRAPDLFPAFATMAWAGLRLGEALALLPEDLDFTRQRITVQRQIGRGTKNHKARPVDMADSLRDLLRELLAEREALLRKHRTSTRVVTLGGEPLVGVRYKTAPGRWILFPDLGPTPTAKDAFRVESRVRAVMTRLLEHAGLPQHFTPHSLRHSYGSQLIADSVSPAYVQRQLGHSSIQVTVDVYGSWLPMADLAAVSRHAGATAPKPTAPPPLGSSLVANRPSEAHSEGCAPGSDGPQVLQPTGTEGRRLSPGRRLPPRSPCTCT